MAQRKGEEAAGYRREDEGVQPPYLYPEYVATRLRAPKKPLIILPGTLSDTTGPAYGRGAVGELDDDLTRQHSGEPLGEKIIVTGRVTDGEGRYRFVTVKPGAYPWKNHDNAWRPAHVHFSLFGTAFRSRLITQMYFPGDPLLEHDPIFQSVRDQKARERMISSFDLQTTRPEWALGYRFDIVLEGRGATPMENHR